MATFMNSALTNIPLSLLIVLFPSPHLATETPTTHELSIEISQNAEPNTPIQVSGQVSFHEELYADRVRTQWKINANLLNLSSKTILAYEVSIEAVPDHGGGVSHLAKVDHFFRSELPFTPDALLPLSVATPNWQMTPRTEKTALRLPEATFNVLFVEFADGSKFGASVWGNSLSAVRSQAIEHMRAISEQSRSLGATGLRLSLANALQIESNSKFTNLLLGHIRETLDTKGPDGAVDEIRELLSTAESRKRVL
jgi:hypothetical protein